MIIFVISTYLFSNFKFKKKSVISSKVANLGRFLTIIVNFSYLRKSFSYFIIFLYILGFNKAIKNITIHAIIKLENKEISNDYFFI